MSNPILPLGFSLRYADGDDPDLTVFDQELLGQKDIICTIRLYDKRSGLVFEFEINGVKGLIRAIPMSPADEESIAKLKAAGW